MRQVGPELREALDPLVRTALTLSPADRLAWLEALRVEAPALAEALDGLLREAAPTRDSIARGRSAGEAVHRSPRRRLAQLVTNYLKRG